MSLPVCSRNWIVAFVTVITWNIDSYLGAKQDEVQRAKDREKALQRSRYRRWPAVQPRIAVIMYCHLLWYIATC
jgi:hypothetical protein